MIQRPHISTLFPYTTLFRSDEILKLIDREMPFRMRPTKGEYYILSSKAKGFVNKVIYPLPTKMGKGILLVPQTNGEIMRSEEHTSELQSRPHLVCRLLLEKK